MYDKTFYVPKTNKDTYGESIFTQHGVTQGRKTSANLFSLNISKMYTAISVKSSFLKNINLLQLADDTALLTESLETLKEIFTQVLAYSKSKFMVANLKKTYYMHLCKQSINIPLEINDNQTIHPAKDGKYTYLGMLFTPTNDITEIIEANLKSRSFHIKKYFEWIDVNEHTPIKIKLQVLDACMLSAYLYGAETWWKIDNLAETILIQERKLLKRILGVKKGTSNELIYIELNRPDIISKIKDLQYNFNQKVSKTSSEDAIVADAYNMCKELPIYGYYNSLRADNQKCNKFDRITSVRNSNATMCLRYRNLFNLNQTCIIYDSYLNDEIRTILSRWRLSSFDLHVETGRYNKTLREMRICNLCQDGNIEDEYHVIFVCNFYNVIRHRYHVLLQDNNTISKLLNPTTIADCYSTSKLLMEIEDKRK